MTPTNGSSSILEPARVLVTGAAGQIAYSILPMIASGRMLGNRPIILHLLDIPQAAEKLKGVVMELEDCYFPLVHKIVATVDIREAFENVDVALLIGAFPRMKGMERSELLQKNAAIFKEQGRALADYASPDVKVCVVGNPANTNCLIALKATNGRLPPQNFTAMTRLDQNRAMSCVKDRLGLQGGQELRNVIIWGNHSANQYPDLSHAVVSNYPIFGVSTNVSSAINDENWIKSVFVPSVQKRGAKIIEARKLSSAASAANAAVDHVRSWIVGTEPGEVVSMGVISDGSYGAPSGVIFSFPVTCSDGQWTIVKGFKLNPVSREMMQKSSDELVDERAAAL
eukprot:CAMPEP_0201489808 /NCGR_PEP_ID=MMETSP0151_2-20130828/23788_1 /ASSEMBLY_ACC=CAM_ASM_000257 /TAXON_ID=200890 /ORGANISM="Paramoeba atlantica, Strain 621/1 / CCAP 1560/9" /LENGTH=340 /DNA_ID=CAMNT_0047875507 /DNA_START=200 /DNA_END=1219 /DNA_ORIENTATION=-